MPLTTIEKDHRELVAGQLNHAATVAKLTSERYVAGDYTDADAAAELVLLAKALWRLAYIADKKPLPSRHQRGWKLNRVPGAEARGALHIELVPATHSDRTVLQSQASTGRTGFCALRWEHDHAHIILTGLHVKPQKG